MPNKARNLLNNWRENFSFNYHNTSSDIPSTNRPEILPHRFLHLLQFVNSPDGLINLQLNFTCKVARVGGVKKKTSSTSVLFSASPPFLSLSWRVLKTRSFNWVLWRRHGWSDFQFVLGRAGGILIDHFAHVLFFLRKWIYYSRRKNIAHFMFLSHFF